MKRSLRFSRMYLPWFVLLLSFSTALPQSIIAQQGTFTATNSVNTYLVKIDQKLSSRHQIFGRYNFSRNRAENATFTGVTQGALTNNGTERDRTHTLVISANSVLSPARLNEFRWQYSHEEQPRLNNREGPDFISKVGPTVEISGCCSLGGVSFLPIQEHDRRLQFTDNFSWVKGAHSFKVGFDNNRSLANQVFRRFWRGIYVFLNNNNYVRALNRTINPATGQPYTADAFLVSFGPGTFQESVNEYAAYAQNAFKLSNRLNLNFGLRYEASLMPQPTRPNPLLPQTGRINSDKQMWQPRLGFSWDITGSGKTVLRIGGGLSYARTPLILVNQAFNFNGGPDVGVAFTLNSTQIAAVQKVHAEFVFPFVPDTSKAANSSYITAAGIDVKPDATFFEPNFHNPRSLQYTAGIEHQIYEHMAVSIDYVHNHTVHLQRIHDINLAPPRLELDNSTPPVLRERFTAPRPNPNFNILRQHESSARSNYDVFTLTIKRRYAKKLEFLTNYTLAYNRDDDSNERNFGGINYVNAFNFKPEYRWSRNDIRHRWVLSGTYDLPRGFRIGSILEWRTGSPFSAFTGSDSNLDGQLTDKPVINGVPLLRNSFRQPNFFNHDLRVSKAFKFSERHQFSCLVEMFNFWNVRNFLYRVSSNEQDTAIGSRWGRAQFPLPTFRSIYLPDGILNKNGILVGLPFQLQVGLRYSF